MAESSRAWVLVRRNSMFFEDRMSQVIKAEQSV